MRFFCLSFVIFFSLLQFYKVNCFNEIVHASKQKSTKLFEGATYQLKKTSQDLIFNLWRSKQKIQSEQESVWESRKKKIYRKTRKVKRSLQSSSLVIERVQTTSTSARVFYSLKLNISRVEQCRVTIFLHGNVIQMHPSHNLQPMNFDNLLADKWYYALVNCSFKTGALVQSNKASFKTLPKPPLNSPSNVFLEQVNASSINVSWIEPAGVVTFYNLTLTYANGSHIFESTNKTGVIISVGYDQGYTIIIQACNPSGCGPHSSSVVYEKKDKPIEEEDVSKRYLTIVVVIIVMLPLLVALGFGGYIIWKKRLTKKSIVSSVYQESNRLRSQTVPSTNDYYTPMTPQETIITSDSLRDIFGDGLIEKQNLYVGKLLGEGEFGYVYKGKLNFVENGERRVIDVAIKSIKAEYQSAAEIKSFVQEGQRMKNLDHSNVMKLLGICLSNFRNPSERSSLQESPLVVLPFMPHGDLKNHLFLSRSSGNSKAFTVARLLQFALDIARGMEYLSSKNFVHRDLAARNCMLTENYSVVVSDFGLSRELYSQTYYKQTHLTKLPVKWMALESLGDNIFNSKTDVWSFGVTAWEIFTLCQTPYPGVANHEVYDHLRRGVRLSKPSCCSYEMWNRVVSSCWLAQADDRITFEELVSCLSHYVQHPEENMLEPMVDTSKYEQTSYDYEKPMLVSFNGYKLAEENENDDEDKTENGFLVTANSKLLDTSEIISL